MPKHSHSSSSSSSSNHKKHKIDSICSDCSSSSSSDKNYLDSNCKEYFNKNNLIHSNDITELNANDYLELRKTKFAKLDIFELKKDEEDCIVINSGDNTIKINQSLIQSKNITISKYIANGCYGVIFVSSVEDDDIRYVIKFIKNNPNNENEIKTMIDIKQNNNTHIPNFINIAYYHLNCNRITHQDTGNKILTGIKNCLKTDKYSMIVLEYFDGTIFDLINSNFPLFSPIKNFTDEKIELFNSIFAQLIITIFLFHNKFEYYHNDTHLKNFLYKKVNNDNKYFHYKIRDKDYYIKNCGYVIVLSDYGLSKKINEHYTNKDKKNKLKDYEDILNKICLYKNKIITGDINQFTHYKDMSNKKNKTDFSSFDEFDFLNYMMTTILNIKTTQIVDMTLINDIPYH